jgi:hypothetical protein
MILKGDLAAVALDEMADQVFMPIDIEHACHPLSSLRRRWRSRDDELNAECMQDRQDLTDFRGFFPPFEFYDESQTCAGAQGERLLRYAVCFPGLADQFADVVW